MSARTYTIVLFVLSLIFYWSFLGRVHLFDWDEINFAESAREMLVTGNFTQVQINYRPFWEKPPLFFWLQALSMQIFGTNEWAARFPNALFGLITLLTLLQVGSRLYSPRMGFWWAMAYFGSFLPHLYFKSGIIDPVFNYFIFLGVYFLSQSIEQKSTRYAVFAGLATGLAVLTKGPVGFLLVLLSFLVFWASERFRKVTSLKDVVLFALSVAVVSLAWFAVELWRGGWWFFKMFIDYQIRLFSTPDAGHEQPFYYHFVVVFLGCFPMSVFALAGFRQKNDAHPVFRKKMIFLFWVVMILFSIVKTKIVHYSSMAYLPLSFLAAQRLSEALDKNNLPKWQIWLTGIMGTIFSALLIALPLFAYNKAQFYNYIADPFAVDCLKTPVVWEGWEFLIGVFYWLMLIVGLFFLMHRHLQVGFLTIFMATALCLLVYTAVVVPKIEGYSQAPAINFYKKLQESNPDSYVTTIWFKSYAHYFYFKYPRYSQKEFYQQDTYQENQQWLLTGSIDKDAYFVVKSNDIERFRQEYPKMIFLKKEGGFGFFKREAYLSPRSED